MSSTVQLPAESATYVRWQLEQRIADLGKAEAAARRRASANVVARPAEEYLATALRRAQAELKAAHAGVNPTEQETACSRHA